jgi:hypothetical protein
MAPHGSLPCDTCSQILHEADMKRLVLAVVLLMTSNAWAQSKPKPAAVDPCAPIGRTADGRFVYSLSCETLPAPVAPRRADGSAASQSAASQSVAPVEEEDKGGLFRNPFPNLVRPSNDERLSGVGPSTGGR